jgi:hypothetical protein
MLTLAYTASSQITTGSTYIGGTISFNNNKEEANNVELKSNSFLISPSIGKAIRENLIFGVDLNYLRTEQEFLTAPKLETKGYGAGVFLRKYFPIVNRFFVFGHSNLGFVITDIDQGTGNTRIEGDGFGVNLGLSPGISYYVGKNLYLEAGFNNLVLIAYNEVKTTQHAANGTTTETKSTDYSLSSSLSNSTDLNIGVRFIIPRRRR